VNIVPELVSVSPLEQLHLQHPSARSLFNLITQLILFESRLHVCNAAPQHNAGRQPGSGLTFVKLLSHSRRNKRLNCIVVDIDAR
jgi:hypothetical protein